MELIIIKGGLPGEPAHALAGKRAWPRHDGESAEAFTARAAAEAEAAGEKGPLLIGGSPELPIYPTSNTTTVAIDVMRPRLSRQSAGWSWRDC